MGLEDLLMCGANNCQQLETERCAEQLVTHAETHYELDQSEAPESIRMAAALTTCGQVKDIQDRDVRHDAGMRIYSQELEQRIDRAKQARERALEDWAWAIDAYNWVDDGGDELVASLEGMAHVFDEVDLGDAVARYAHNLMQGAIQSLTNYRFQQL